MLKQAQSRLQVKNCAVIGRVLLPSLSFVDVEVVGYALVYAIATNVATVFKYNQSNVTHLSLEWRSFFNNCKINLLKKGWHWRTVCPPSPPLSTSPSMSIASIWIVNTPTTQHNRSSHHSHHCQSLLSHIAATSVL